ncbi:MAG: hypothetical protein O3C27_11960 [Actinomycetota bacterium]|nr:hypothetical protein [Actinomycetota bacterium]
MASPPMYKCLVNGAIGADARRAIVDGLTELTGVHFGEHELTVEFIEIPEGRWFTAGRPSRASMVLGTVPTGTAQGVRVTFMDAIARLFADATDTDYHDVMVSAPDRKVS